MTGEITRLTDLKTQVDDRLNNGVNENTADFEAFLKSIKESLANAE